MSEIIELVNKAFTKLQESKTIAEVEEILDALCIAQKYRMNVNSYPRISFKITKDEIIEMKHKELDPDFNIILPQNAGSLTKLLYALAWKNGDLKKIRHIVEGIYSDDVEEKNVDLCSFSSENT